MSAFFSKNFKRRAVKVWPHPLWHVKLQFYPLLVPVFTKNEGILVNMAFVEIL